MHCSFTCYLYFVQHFKITIYYYWILNMVTTFSAVLISNRCTDHAQFGIHWNYGNFDLQRQKHIRTYKSVRFQQILQIYFLFWWMCFMGTALCPYQWLGTSVANFPLVCSSVKPNVKNLIFEVRFPVHRTYLHKKHKMSSPNHSGSLGNTEDDELTLPRASINKMIKELVPSVRIANEARELVLNCCTEFIHLLSSEANDICNQLHKKTINAEHILMG